MKLLLLTCLLLAFVKLTPAQDSLPIIGSPADLNGMTKAYVIADNTDDRKLIVATLKRDKKTGIEVVGDPAEAQFFLEYHELSRENTSRVRTTELQYRSEMRAYFKREDGKTVEVWSDTETYNQTGGLSFDRPNAVNLALNFLKELKKARKGK